MRLGTKILIIGIGMESYVLGLLIYFSLHPAHPDAMIMIKSTSLDNLTEFLFNHPLPILLLIGGIPVIIAGVIISILQRLKVKFPNSKV